LKKLAKMALLVDFYGSLLTEKQQRVWELYFSEDLSLSEIAELEGISRQAVYDLIKRTERILTEYEFKMGLIARFLSEKKTLSQALKLLKPMASEHFLQRDRWEDFSRARQMMVETLAEFDELDSVT
jgi:predicted DNA-binding protein YlxM (UPF0122 family)